MPWGVYITRAEDWSMNEGHWIRPEEFLAVARTDGELQVVVDTGPYIAEWLPDPSMGDGPCFQWDAGNIYCQRPSDEALLKLEDLAAKLGATLQSEDGDIFRNGEPVKP